MKILGLSDMHGIGYDLPKLEEVDYAFIGGDVSPLKIQAYTKDMRDWMRNNFISWLLALPVRKNVFVVAGNHDFFFERHEDEVREMFKAAGGKLVYLNNEIWKNDELEVFGSPWCKTFGNWAFMRPVRPETEAEELYPGYKDFIEEAGRKTILLTHDAPYGLSDILLQTSCPWASGDHIGNWALRKLIEEKQPDLHLHGHLHSTSHKPEYLRHTEVRCISILDENYNATYEPLILEL